MSAIAKCFTCRHPCRRIRLTKPPARESAGGASSDRHRTCPRQIWSHENFKFKEFRRIEGERI